MISTEGFSRVQCTYCKRFWHIHTLSPQTFKYVARLCPNCVAAGPLMRELYLC